jgi:hypothetical protein
MHYGINQFHKINNLKQIIIRKIMKMSFMFLDRRHKIILYIKLEKNL